MSRTPARLCAALLTTTALTVALAAPAWAHVSVSSTDAAKGGFGKVTFRVPNESDDAATTKVSVQLPADAPFAFVSAESKPGWTVKTTTEKLDEPTKVGDFDVTEAVRTVTWTATDGGIDAGQFDEFALSGGPFPDADDISFAATQTYDDGEVVQWDEQQKGSTEPEHPAPVLALAAADTGEHSDTAATAPTSGTSSEDGVALTVAIAAAVVALAALLVSVRQTRRRA